MRAELEAAGRPFGPSDLLIAAHAGAIGAVLVTDNTDEFSRVRGLRVENWIRSSLSLRFDSSLLNAVFQEGQRPQNYA
ncbi:MULTISPECIES: hypothetical protein [Paracoccus]|uniref:PIN domain-containing protein n=1 Tax=Paracoccus marinaquae TaxID=2841926 RepID=A0ABS6ALX0_9RHOB|nr:MULTISPECIES: hypothetical protein [Paracoccus]MBU3031592.1 hypothetical protein [Paracoccus marinaquae]